MRSALLFLLLFVWFQFSSAQEPGHKFTVDQLRQDLAELRKQVLNAHANPYTELSKDGYEQVFKELSDQVKREMTATEFLKLIKPVVSHLSDEHAAISLSKALLSDDYRTGTPFLPFSLKRQGRFLVVDELLVASSGVAVGQRIDKIDGQAVGGLLKGCADYATGFPQQRQMKALREFGLLYGYMRKGSAQGFTVESDHRAIQLKGATGEVWLKQLMKMAGQDQQYDRSITYTRYGKSGYMNVRAFNARNQGQLDSLKKVTAGIFRQMKEDQVENLFIDVSKNSGGNSAVGDMLTDFFNEKPYLNYQCNWRRSDEYLALMKSWGVKNRDYEALKPGEILHYSSEKEYPEQNNPYRFKGKTYVIIGDGTFSSAIMFATVIKDNQLATLVGKVPSDGHPTHFGELYAFKLPNTKIDVRFGVKQWVRPGGKSLKNVLQPDIAVATDQLPEQLIHAVLGRQNIRSLR